jgi:glyoxylase-like metal-dependent hydrolase (beta-lactamase superfamily II)
MLVSIGSGVLGVAVLDTTTACGGSSSPAGGATSAGDASSQAAGAASGGASTSSAGGATLAWHRVSLTIVSAYLLVRGSEVAIVDTGTVNSEDAIGAGLTAAGVGWGGVRHIVLTHKHPDHAGGLPSLQPAVPGATLYAGRADIDGIPSSGKTVTALADGDEVFGLRALTTPGHTPGHISVFDPSTGVLVAGDALRTTNGLQGSDPQYTDNASDAAASVKKLALLDVRVILPGHGDPLTSGASDALRKLASSL